jgi:hypothetical protein
MSSKSDQSFPVNQDRVPRLGNLRRGRLSEIDQALGDMRYWLSRPIAERFAALEKSREEARSS